MALFRFALFFFLLTAGVLFALYVWTGKEHYRAYGLTVLKWTVGAALVFFGVLALEQLS
jgi:hypothetical protein